MKFNTFSNITQWETQIKESCGRMKTSKNLAHILSSFLMEYCHGNFISLNFKMVGWLDGT